MKNSGKCKNMLSKEGSRSVVVALASAFVLAATMFASPSAQAQTFTLLYSFQGPPLDGWVPEGQLVFDQAGNLYGTTQRGGSSALGAGILFELNTSGTESVLHNFSGTAGDGAYPIGQILRYQGNIYGVTGGGGTGCTNGCGTVFELSRGEEIITDLDANPSAGLARDGSGSLFGTTVIGSGGPPPPSCGNEGSTNGCGTVFEVSQGQERILYSFGGKPDGAGPCADLVVDQSGNLYGTTQWGGTWDAGTVFELSPNLDGTWTEHLLYSFRGKSDGANPVAGVVRDANGNLYGTTFEGGHLIRGDCDFGCGVVFKLRQNSNGTWTELVLHRFGETIYDGRNPFFGSVVRDKHGNLFGTTYLGGFFGNGVVFEVDTAGNEIVLHTFTGGANDGSLPFAGLTLDSSGNLYGTTAAGGAGVNAACGLARCGTVFKITP